MTMDNLPESEKAYLVGVELTGENALDIEESLKELAMLAETAGARVAGISLQKRSRPDAATFIGRGKVEEIKAAIQDLQANLVICDRELSPAQLRNLENSLDVKVIDRTQLILDIFARRARTREGKLQVELAQLNYILPRLTGIGIQLSRLGGGIGTRGPGETKLEVDRRKIRKRIADLRHEIDQVKRHRNLLRSGRKKVPFPLVALVGYTNAGKSTLLNTLTGADVLVEDKLFATLDPTTRRVVLPDNQTILLTDTVGFIGNLPHHLVAAFRATLEEVIEADLLLHVADICHPNIEAQVKSVEKVLESLEAIAKPTLMVYNKMDRRDRECRHNLPADREAVFISAKTGENINELLKKIAVILSGGKIIKTFFVPYDKSSILPLIHENARILSQKHLADGVEVHVEIQQLWAARIAAKMRQGDGSQVSQKLIRD
ncbi:GTP-binding protein HflX [Desulfocucumis palustris]|uniref:GTPase HflX n=1 Tax=Desulfocucumis palustris TaxID=1898651 RepID=A0A2L2XCK8_9FIRM|nr:GTPase HflX [Desulfocucumis palustris]GBF34077.1 GTP-binding protein HflX [Desulfocucumis palustris]